MSYTEKTILLTLVLYLITFHIAIGNDAIKIMPLGNSITQADHTHNSYRRNLWKKIKKAGFNIDFVGSQNVNFGGEHPSPDFDLDHEGHWGWKTSEILGELNDWALTYRPEIVLIHLGHNDLAQRESVKAIRKNFERMIKILRQNNPRMKIFIAHLIFTEIDTFNDRIQKLNEQLTTLANSRSTEKSPILIVPINPQFDPFRHTYDGIHPNTAGEEIMAESWYQQILPLLKND